MRAAGSTVGASTGCITPQTYHSTRIPNTHAGIKYACPVSWVLVSKYSTGCPESSLTGSYHPFSPISTEQQVIPTRTFYISSFKPASHQVIVAKRLRRHMRSRGRSIPDLGSFGNMDVAESGQSSEPLRSQAVGIVDSGLVQGQSGDESGTITANSQQVVDKIFEGRSHGRQNMFRTSFCVSCVAKIVCCKTLSKRGHGFHKLANFDRQGLPDLQDDSPSGNWNHIEPKTAQKALKAENLIQQHMSRLNCCKMVKNGATKDFGRITWSDESMFRMTHKPQTHKTIVFGPKTKLKLPCVRRSRTRRM